MIFSLLYETVLIILALFTFPKMLWQMCRTGKYRSNFLRRFGCGFPTGTRETGDSLIWLHAPSVGEVKALAPFAKALLKQPGRKLLISTTTETGFAEAKRAIPEAHDHAYLPFDFLWIVRPLMKRVRPDLLILCESDIWYNLLREAKRQGAHTALINGKLSEKSLHRFQTISFLSRRLFSQIDHFCVQNALYADRFCSLGIPEEKIHVTGNLKFAGQASSKVEQAHHWKQTLGIAKEAPLLVIGSTHEEEEAMLLNELSPLWEEWPDLKIFLVPRHPERFSKVARFLEKQGIPYRTISEEKPLEERRVLLVDAMGLLTQLYQIADIAIVAGSFVSHVGGHNILEPCDYAVPVLFGPHMHTQQELVSLVEQNQCGKQLSLKELASEVQRLLRSKQERETMGKAGIDLMKSLKGSLKKTLSFLFPV